MTKILSALLLFLSPALVLSQHTQATQVDAGQTNQALNPASCAWHPGPAWCSGSDIGAWTNAAIKQLSSSCGEIYMAAGSYSQTTSIVIPRCFKLHGASAGSTILNPSGGIWSIIIADSSGAGNYPMGAVEDLSILCPSTSNYGVYVGGSTGLGNAPSTSIDPSTNYGDHTNLNRLRVGDNSHACGVGIQFGNNVWQNTISNSLLDENSTQYSFPASLDNSGENMVVVNSSIQNGTGVGFQLANNAALSLTLANDKIDYNSSWAIQNGTSRTNNVVAMVGGDIEQYAQFAQNYGVMSFDGVTFLDGTQSGILGYLIDNESRMVLTGGYLHNGGTGNDFNSSGSADIAIFGTLATTAFNIYATYVDGTGSIYTGGLLSVGNKVTSYNGKSTASNGIPILISTFNATAQSSSYSGQNLVSSPAAGMYRVSVYEEITQAAKTSSTLPTVTLAYRAEDSGQLEQPAITQSSSTANTKGTFLSGVFTFTSVSGTNVRFSNSGYASSGTTPMQYAIRIRVEYLGPS
jgi:hypothetical protein